jgi:hypothetical protein
MPVNKITAKTAIHGQRRTLKLCEEFVADWLTIARSNITDAILKKGKIVEPLNRES